MRKRVSIISVVYNQVEVTLDLLQSLQEQEYRMLEIIIVDNGSTEDTSILKNRFPEIKLIRSERNLGFAGGNNLGIRVAKGYYLFFVNNDTVIPKGTISHLVEAFGDLPQAGMICPLITYYDHPETLQYAGATEINPWTGRNHAIGFRRPMVKSEKICETSYAHGAALLTTRKLVSEIGLMPENYFLYYEELDWSQSFRKAGLKIYVDHHCHILHKESMSTGKASPLKTYYQTRNRILFMRRHFGRRHRLAFFTFFVLLTIPKTTLKLITRGKLDLLRAFFKGVKSHFPQYNYPRLPKGPILRWKWSGWFG